MTDIGARLPSPLAPQRIEPALTRAPEMNPGAAAAGARRGERHALRFAGSGSEYFRIWIVNLLLTLVTFGIYYPWAKVRRLRYFHTNTLVAGHALDFHGRPGQMLRGFALVGLLFMALGALGRIAPLAETIGLLLLAAMWPALWRASLQFRLANTSWRGMRFAFTGSLGGAYGAFAVPLIALAAFAAAIGLAAPAGDAPPGRAAALAPVLMLVALYALLPYGWLRLKRYQHGHYAYAQHRTELRTTAGAVYGIFVRAAGVALLAFALLGVMAAVAMAVIGVQAASGTFGRGAAGTLLAFAPLVVLAVLAAQLLPRAYVTARIQNLLWTRTGNAHLRFESALGVMPLVRLMLKNWLLVALTLGLYWPWAAVAMARLRLEAVTLRTRDAIDLFAAGTRGPRGDAAGDAAGDVFGVDFGL